MSKIIKFIKKETVFCVAGVLAIATAFVVHPSKAYIGYIDFRVLALLLCLMLVVQGLKSFGIFTVIIEKITSGIHNTRVLELILVFICFFSGMLITNDVALITFVPFAIELLTVIGKKDRIIYIIVLQTAAANLGSMVTPIGNPQNLFIYTKYSMGIGDFFLTMLPYAVTAMLMLAVCVCVLPSDKLEARPQVLRTGDGNVGHDAIPIWKTVGIVVVFGLCIACVARVLDYRIMLLASLVLTAVVDYRLLLKADYMLLLTFVAFFIMTGNLGAVESISGWLSGIIKGREIMAAILSSQVISNVPAAVLLADFTENAKDLLIGVNIGGLGTLIASMASLISFRYYGETENASKGKYIAVFTGVNILFLGIMLLVRLLTGT